MVTKNNIYTESSIQNYKIMMPSIIAAANQILYEEDTNKIETAIISFQSIYQTANTILEKTKVNEQKYQLQQMVDELYQINKDEYSQQSFRRFEMELAPCLAMAIRILADEQNPCKVNERMIEFEKRKNMALLILQRI